MRAPEGMQAGALRRISLSKISVYNADTHFANIISGSPNNDIEDVTLSNIRIWYRPIDSTQNKIVTAVPEPVKPYPEPVNFGGVLPVYGLFIRYAKKLN